MKTEEEPRVAEAPEDGPLTGNVSLDSTVPTGGDEPTKGATKTLPAGAKVVGRLDLECIGPNFKRIEIGLHKETGDVAIKAIGFENQYEMLGFIHSWCRADIIIDTLSKRQG